MRSCSYNESAFARFFKSNTWEKLSAIIISELVLAVQNLKYILSWKRWLIVSERVLTAVLSSAWQG